MGCNNSKKSDAQDNQRSRVDTQTRVGAQNNGASNTNTMPINSSGRRDFAQRDLVMAASPHESRFEERDFFKGLVEQTESNLIDISQAPEYLVGVDAEARQRDYTALLETVRPNAAADKLFALPTVSAKNADPATVLAVPITTGHEETVVQWSTAVSAAVSEMAVTDVGPIVIALPAVVV